VRFQGWSLRRARLLAGTNLILVTGLVGFVVLIWVIEQVAGIHGAVSLSAPLAMVVAGVPAALWLGFFYLQDRHEPEPKELVAGVFALGALIAGPLADFLLRWLAPAQPLQVQGLSVFSLDHTIHAVLVVGLAQELCKYVVVRYTIYTSREFDEPMDGVVYMMAAGTGFAVWQNYHGLQELADHSVLLSTGVAMVVVTTLAHASFAGALGYVMGRAKFSPRPPAVRAVLLGVGLLIAALLNGQFTLFETWISSTGLEHHPWKSVGYAAVFAAVMFLLLMLASRRLLRDSPFNPEKVR
jgi:RsiW-degrading membrane proteinase PrsW (M82 family)